MFDKRHDLAKFLVVVETGTMLAAAERLGITQPALSRIVSKLEEQFKGQLFERSSVGVRVTPLGRMVAERAQHILNEIELAEEEINAALSGRTGVLFMTAEKIWAQSILPTAISKFHRSYPDVQLNFRAATHIEGIQLLTSGESELHFGNIRADETLSPLLISEPILDLTWGIVAHEDHPLQFQEIDCSDLARYPWIEYDGCEKKGDWDQDALPSLTHVKKGLCQHTSHRVKKVVRASLTGFGMMQEGDYLSFLPVSALDKLPGASIRPLDTDIGKRSHRLGLISKRSARCMSAYTCLREIVRDVALKELGNGAEAQVTSQTCRQSRMAR